MIAFHSKEAGAISNLKKMLKIFINLLNIFIDNGRLINVSQAVKAFLQIFLSCKMRTQRRYHAWHYHMWHRATLCATIEQSGRNRMTAASRIINVTNI